MIAARILRTSSSSIEPLECRIAPALLVNGANLLGAGGPATGETSVGDNSITLVKVLSGQALVWFDGAFITSISVGPGTKLDVTGGVGIRFLDSHNVPQFIPGDIVANLTAAGKLSDSDNDPSNGEDGGVLLANDILGITTHPLGSSDGTVGNIITGGAVNNVSVAGKLSGVYAGDGVFRGESTLAVGGAVTSTVLGVDINPIEAGVQSDFVFAKSTSQFKAGASINQLTVTTGQSLQLFAGNGNPSGVAATGNASAGGSVANVTIKLASVAAGAAPNTPSYFLIAGDGGDGKTGGAGGSIQNVSETTASGPVTIIAGKGGVGNGGAGGAGGSVLNLDAQSPSVQYNVTSGAGGAGTPGGAGGKINSGNFSNRTPTSGVLVTADFTGDGNDDVLVADSGSGEMVLSKSNGPGAGFTQVAQNGTDVTIAPLGSGPVDALATDVNGDGKLDAVVIYRDGTMAAYLNQGDGVFYNNATSAFATVGTSLGFAPTKFTEISSGGGIFAIAENTDGKGTLHGEAFNVDTSGTLKAESFPGTIKYTLPIADVVQDFVGLTSGAIEQFQATFVDNGNALQTFLKLPAVQKGGLSDLDVDATHSHLLALSSSGHSVTVYDLTGGSPVALSPVISLSSVAGTPLEAKFIHDASASTDDDIVVLTNTVNAAALTLITAPPQVPPGATQTQAYTITNTEQAAELLHSFSAQYLKNVSDPHLIALPGALDVFVDVANFSTEQSYPLPFASKQVTLTTGAGGKGLDVGTKLGKGGAGGSITSINIEAQTITLATGQGGDSTNGPAGAGGSISNTGPTTFKTPSGSMIAPKLSADLLFTVNLGNGGTPTGTGGKTASGGAGGGINGLAVTLAAGSIQLTTGTGGAGNGAAGGAGGDAANLTINAQGGLTITAGFGGAANGAAGNGGKGGAISGLNYKLELDPDAEAQEVPIGVILTTGYGGTSAGGIGGAAGDVNGVTLSLDGPDRTVPDPLATPPVPDTHNDSTVTVSITANYGGDGAKGGGTGGTLRNIVSDSIFDQEYKGVGYVNYVVMSLTAGHGGASSSGNGGGGGSIVLGKPIAGITYADPDNANAPDAALELIAGPGGSGAGAGGNGGSISGLTAENPGTTTNTSFSITLLESAIIVAGGGGDGVNGSGGIGGSVSNVLIGVNGDAGSLDMEGGQGGKSTNAKGGAGGGVLSSEIGLVASGLPVGMTVLGGAGGAGKLGGGVGGMLSNLSVNTPQSTANISAQLLAGNGGDATSAAGVGGKGGNILGIVQAKDYNSSINLIQAGNGGENLLGKAGAGGDVTNIRTVGFIGRPSNSQGARLGVFDGSRAQGVFSGRGGDGATDGTNGAISNVVARQIAAMASAVDPLTGLFAVASKISNVTAELIGFDVDRDGVFDTTAADGAAPSGTKPVDGFILAAALSKVTGGRPAFTFMA